MVTSITGSSQAVELGGGFRLRAPGQRGTAEVLPTAVGRTRAATFSANAGIARLEDALAATNVSESKLIELFLQPALGTTAGGPALTGRSATGPGTIELDVPDIGPNAGQLLVSIDAAGTVRWHVPLPVGPAASPSRGPGGTRSFRLPMPTTTPPAASGNAPRSQARGVLGAAGRLLLKALVYPITDPIFGAIGNEFAARWEAAKRPYRLRPLTVDNYRIDECDAITDKELASLSAGGPVLLFLHGTFSTAHAAFGGLSNDTLRQLNERYSSRLIAFDHPTLSASPVDNARWLLSHLPSRPVELDVICHSRGGLVGRLLAERPAHANLDASNLNVRRIVFAGVPNNGTLLADPDHMIKMADRFTTALTFLPTGAVTETIEGIVIFVKMLAHGAIQGLPGISSMHPNGAFLTMLNASGNAQTDYFAVTSDFEPTDRKLHAFASLAVEGAADQIFANVANDLVVPTEGVWDRNGNDAFPLQPKRVFTLDRSQGVMHTGFFVHEGVASCLLDWLR